MFPPSALRFGNVNTHRITLPTSVLDNFNPATFAVWTQLNTLSQTAVRFFAKSGTGTHQFFPQDFGGGTYNLDCKRNRATTSCEVAALWTNFQGAAAGIPLFCVGQTDTGTSGNNKLFVGTQNIPVSEPSAYTLQTNGSGTVTSNASQACEIGNANGLNFSLQGVMWWIGIWNRLFNLNELREMQYNPELFKSCSRGFWYPGKSGTSVVLDESGRGFHGAVSGAVLSGLNLSFEEEFAL